MPASDGFGELARKLVELQLLQPRPHGVQLSGAVGHELAALTAEIEGLAQAGLAGVEAIDDLLQPLDCHLIALGLVRQSSSSILAQTLPSENRSLTRSAAVASRALVTAVPSLASTRA